jgi:hypothetical protein
MLFKTFFGRSCPMTVSNTMGFEEHLYLFPYHAAGLL